MNRMGCALGRVGKGHGRGGIWRMTDITSSSQPAIRYRRGQQSRRLHLGGGRQTHSFFLVLSDDRDILSIRMISFNLRNVSSDAQSRYTRRGVELFEWPHGLQPSCYQARIGTLSILPKAVVIRSELSTLRSLFLNKLPELGILRELDYR